MTNYAESLDKLKRRFLIVGLTGYTGSGCSTAARLIMRPEKPELPGDNISLKITDKRRLAKLRRIWEDLPWEKFINIEVSRVIFLFLLNKSFNSKIDNTIFLKAREIVSNAKENFEGISLLLDIEQDVRDPEIAKKVVEAYETFGRQYIPWKNQCNFDLSSFIECMQNFGDQIRKYGEIEPTSPDSISPDNIYVLPTIIKRLIKSFMVANNSKFFVVDAFRNPYEVEYFKRRYSEFYLVAIQRPLRERQESLKTLNEDALKRLEEREQGKKIKNKNSDNIAEWVTSQNIPECVQKADYFIHNYSDTSKTWPFLRLHLIRLLTLAQKSGCIPPEPDERNMQIAMSARQNSGCMSRHVGAVVTNTEGFVLGVGWNDPPTGQVPCTLRTAKELLSTLDEIAFSDYERSEIFIHHIRGRTMGDNPFCFCDELSIIENEKSREFTRALHAEENALIQSMVHGARSLKGGSLYTTDSPCTLCSKKAYQARIGRIVYVEEYPGISIDHSIKVGDKPIKVEQFEGVTGSSFFKLFSLVMPEKDYLMLYK